MNEKIITNRSSAVIVQLENTRADLCGRIYSRFYGSGTDFKGIHEFLNACEDLFDSLACPQAAVKERSFAENRQSGHLTMKAAETVEDMDQIIQTKGKNTFVINVLFRQNASWQGTIQWVNKNKTQHFRSTLELIKLMDSALESEEAVTIGWETNE